MAEGNGVDLGSIYGLLREVAATVSRHDGMLERLTQLAEQHGAVLAQHSERLAALETGMANMATKADLADMRQTVGAYHASVLGHGITISELEERVGRIERHLALPPMVHG